MQHEFKSKYSDDEVFERHETGEKALYLERADDGTLYICDYNDRWVVETDEQIDADVAFWRHIWECGTTDEEE